MAITYGKCTCLAESVITTVPEIIFKNGWVANILPYWYCQCPECTCPSVKVWLLSCIYIPQLSWVFITGRTTAALVHCFWPGHILQPNLGSPGHLINQGNQLWATVQAWNPAVQTPVQPNFDQYLCLLVPHWQQAISEGISIITSAVPNETRA